MYVVKLIERVV